MSDPVIRVENLSKKYVLSHEQPERYASLRDTLTKGAKSLLSPFQNPKSKIQNPKSEEFWALKDVSFEIQQGDRVGIIGRNGAGKSTLLKILSRITEPTSGRISIKGRVASLLEVGTGFHPELTGRENIFLNGAILGMSKEEIKRKFDEIVAFAEIEKFLDTPVKRYSSGMYVRLAFAVAAHLEPEILIVDEVLAVGDVQFQKKCLGKMGEVATQGRTIFFVSHNMGAVNVLCDKVIYLSKGKLRAIGPTSDIVNTYFSEVFQNQYLTLEELRSPGYGEKVKFVGIQLTSETNNIEFGQPIEYQLIISSKIDIKGVSIGSSFFTNSGTCIGSLITQEFDLQANKLVKLKVVVRNTNLSIGTYNAGFSIGFGQKEGTRKELDIVIGTPIFEIVSTQKDSDITTWQPSWGSIFFKDITLLQEESARIYMS